MQAGPYWCLHSQYFWVRFLWLTQPSLPLHTTLTYRDHLEKHYIVLASAADYIEAIVDNGSRNHLSDQTWGKLASSITHQLTFVLTHYSLEQIDRALHQNFTLMAVFLPIRHYQIWVSFKPKSLLHTFWSSIQRWIVSTQAHSSVASKQFSLSSTKSISITGMISIFMASMVSENGMECFERKTRHMRLLRPWEVSSQRTPKIKHQSGCLRRTAKVSKNCIIVQRIPWQASFRRWIEILLLRRLSCCVPMRPRSWRFQEPWQAVFQMIFQLKTSVHGLPAYLLLGGKSLWKW